MKLHVQAKPNGNVEFTVTDESYNGFDITLTPHRLYASYGFFSDEAMARKQICAKIYDYCVDHHETDYYYFKNYIKNLMYFGYNSRGEIIRVANDTDNIGGSQDCKQIYMKDFNHVKERDVLHIVITPFNIDVYKEKKVTTGHTFLDIKNDEELHVYFTYDKNNVNMCVRDAVDIANHCGTKVYYYDVVYHY